MINVHVSVDAFSIPYFEYMIKNYRALAFKPDEVRFYAQCMDKCEASALKLTPYVKAVSQQHHSEGHANSINSALKMGRELGGNNLIADSDTVMLAYGWDEIVERELQYVGVLGATFAPLDTSSNQRRLMYVDKPMFTWFAFSSQFDLTGIDASPAMHSDLPITDERLSRIYGLPVGYALFRDTGWKVPEFLDRHSVSYKTLLHARPRTDARAVKTNDNYNEEYQLDGIPFVGHQRGSRKHTFKSPPHSSIFYSACESYIKDLEIVHPTKRFDIVRLCAEFNKIESYLEIGCKTNETFDKINAKRKVGVDPVAGGTVKMTSDEYFAQTDEKFDLIFIDGDHRCRQVAKDIENSLSHLAEGGMIISHDCNPPTIEYESTDNYKCGDAWKAFVHYRQDPNLDAVVCDVDFGIGVIRRGKNPSPVVLDKLFIDLKWDDLVSNRRGWLLPCNIDNFTKWLKNDAR